MGRLGCLGRLPDGEVDGEAAALAAAEAAALAAAEAAAEAAALGISEAREIGGRLGCQPLLGRADAIEHAKPRVQA